MIKIATLRCTVNVKTKKKSSPAGKTAAGEKPSMKFAQPESQQVSPAGPAPSQTSTTDTSVGERSEGHLSPPSPMTADPRRVADGVYDLILREIRQSQDRGQR